jgi:hypothetical protein
MFYKHNPDGTASDGMVIGVPTPDGVVILSPENIQEIDGWEWHESPPQWFEELERLNSTENDEHENDG